MQSEEDKLPVATITTRVRFEENISEVTFSALVILPDAELELTRKPSLRSLKAISKSAAQLCKLP